MLRDILKDIPVTGDAVKDIQVANKFVTDYLYNLDEVTANAIMDTDIRNRFSIKAASMKSLTTAYKDASKTYQSSAATKRAKAGASIPDWYEPTKYGLRFLPGVLAEYLKKSQHVFYAAGQYYQYTNGVYCEMSEMAAQKLVRNAMLSKETKMAQIVDAEKQWRLLVQLGMRELNVNVYTINVLNGLYNVLEDTLNPHTPEYYSTVQLNVNYDKQADCPLFKRFLEEAMDGDMEQVALLQEMLGYFLIPVNPQIFRNFL